MNELILTRWFRLWWCVKLIFFLQEGAGKCKSSTDMCGEYIFTYNIVKEVLGSDIEGEYFEEQIYLVSFKYLFSNTLRLHEVFPTFLAAVSSLIEIIVCKTFLITFVN